MKSQKKRRITINKLLTNELIFSAVYPIGIKVQKNKIIKEVEMFYMQ